MKIATINVVNKRETLIDLRLWSNESKMQFIKKYQNYYLKILDKENGVLQGYVTSFIKGKQYMFSGNKGNNILYYDDIFAIKIE